MNAFGPAALGLVVALAAAPAAAQQTDFLAAGKVVCVPERMVQCDEANKCESEDASEADKQELLVVDFAGKKYITRVDGKDEPAGEVSEDKVEGQTRSFVLRTTEDGGTFPATLSAAGKLTIKLDGERARLEAACKVEP
jgi:hypothetical protein